MSVIASQITGVSIACSTICPSADQRKHLSLTVMKYGFGNDKDKGITMYSQSNKRRNREGRFETFGRFVWVLMCC